MSIICLDLGATFIKGALIDDKKSEVIYSKRYSFPERIKIAPPGAVEFSTQQILESANSLLDELLKKASNPKAILISNQMHGFVLIDQSNHAQTNFISWQDQRNFIYFDELKEKMGERLLSRYGNELKPGHAITTLYALSKMKKLDVANLMPVSLGDFIVSSITLTKPVLHQSNASGIGGFDLVSSDWDKEFWQEVGLGGLDLPKVTNQLHEVGKYNNISVYSAIGDQQASLYGVGLANSGSLSLNIATGSQVSTLSNKYVPGSYQIRPYFDGYFLKTITHIPAGRAINFLLKSFGRECNNKETDDERLSKIWDQAVNEAAKLQATELIVKLSFFPSATGSSGQILNITENNLTLGNLLLASYNNIAQEHYYASQRLENLKNISDILISGGLVAKSEYLKNQLQDLFGMPITLALETEDALIGLAKLYSKIN